MLRIMITLGLFAAMPSSAAPSARAQDDDKAKAVLGQWYYEVDGMAVAWMITKGNDGAWLVRGQYITPKTRKILGGFEGKDYKFEDGKLAFTRTWLRKPKPNFQDGGKATVESIGNGKVKLIIKEGGVTHSYECSRLAGT